MAIFNEPVQDKHIHHPGLVIGIVLGCIFAGLIFTFGVFTLYKNRLLHNRAHLHTATNRRHHDTSKPLPTPRRGLRTSHKSPQLTINQALRDMELDDLSPLNFPQRTYHPSTPPHAPSPPTSTVASKYTSNPYTLEGVPANQPRVFDMPPNLRSDSLSSAGSDAQQWASMRGGARSEELDNNMGSMARKSAITDDGDGEWEDMGEESVPRFRRLGRGIGE